MLVKDCAQPITIEPMRGFRVIKDFVVDMEHSSRSTARSSRT